MLQRFGCQAPGCYIITEEGDASGVADDNVFTRVRQKLNLPPATVTESASV
ncbi:MAG: hypothetical protein ABSE86_11825 [Bryobacteraceae bacterium]